MFKRFILSCEIPFWRELGGRLSTFHCVCIYMYICIQCGDESKAAATNTTKMINQFRILQCLTWCLGLTLQHTKFELVIRFRFRRVCGGGTTDKKKIKTMYRFDIFYHIQNISTNLVYICRQLWLNICSKKKSHKSSPMPCFIV